jgi:hypothetical protein
MSDSTSSVFDQFVKQHVGRWRDVTKLIAALRRRFSKKKYPSSNIDEQQRLLASVHDFIGVVSKDHHDDLIVDYLNGRNRGAIRRTVQRELNPSDVVDNVIEAANACARGDDNAYVDPTLNTARFNLLKTLVGQATRADLVDRGLLVCTTHWAKVRAHVEHEGLDTPWIDDRKRGRKATSQDMLDAIRAHVSKDENSKTLPQGKAEVADARALTKTKAELYRQRQLSKRAKKDVEQFRAYMEGICAGKVSIKVDEKMLGKLGGPDMASMQEECKRHFLAHYGDKGFFLHA